MKLLHLRQLPLKAEQLVTLTRLSSDRLADGPWDYARVRMSVRVYMRVHTYVCNTNVCMFEFMSKDLRCRTVVELFM